VAQGRRFGVSCSKCRIGYKLEQVRKFSHAQRQLREKDHLSSWHGMSSGFWSWKRPPQFGGGGSAADKGSSGLGVGWGLTAPAMFRMNLDLDVSYAHSNKASSSTECRAFIDYLSWGTLSFSRKILLHGYSSEVRTERRLGIILQMQHPPIFTDILPLPRNGIHSECVSVWSVDSYLHSN
jgi:hypothetical protein